MAINYVYSFHARKVEEISFESKRLTRESLRLISSRAFSLALIVDWGQIRRFVSMERIFSTIKRREEKIILNINRMLIMLIEIGDSQLQGYGKESLFRVQGSTDTTLGRGCLLDRIFASPWTGFVEDNGNKFNLVSIFIAGRYTRDNNFNRVDDIHRLQVI